jgi:hypothetical protein
VNKTNTSVLTAGEDNLDEGGENFIHTSSTNSGNLMKEILATA